MAAFESSYRLSNGQYVPYTDAILVPVTGTVTMTRDLHTWSVIDTYGKSINVLDVTIWTSNNGVRGAADTLGDNKVSLEYEVDIEV